MFEYFEKPGVVLPFMAAVIFGVYTNSLQNAFHYDDRPTIVENPAIRSLGNIPSYFISKQAFSTDELFASPKHYRPVLLTTYAVNYALGGLNPPVYHLMNILLHMLSSLLVYFIAFRLVSNGLAASLSALIYGLHPIHTEALNYISARSSLLSGFFYLLAFYSFIKFRFAQAEKTHLIWTPYLLFLFSFFLAILSKEVAVVLPVTTALYDLYYSRKHLQGDLRRMLLPYVPFLMALIVYILSGNIHSMVWSIIQGYGARDFWPHLLTQTKVTVLYLLLFLWPVVLTPDRQILVANSIGDGAVLTSFGLIGIIFLIAYGLFRIRSDEAKACSLGLLWFMATSLPTILIPLNLLIQEQRAYLPVVGLAFTTGIGLAWLFKTLTETQRVPKAIGQQPRYIVVLLAGLLVMIIAGYGLLIVKRNAVWKDDITLWSDAASKPVSGFRAHVNLGTAYERQNRLDLAIQSYEKALELNPDFFATHYNLGLVYQKLEKADLAIIHFQEAIRINPGFPPAHRMLGMTYATVGQADLAIHELQKALQLNASDLLSQSALGWLYLTEGHFDQAEPYFHQVLQAWPDSFRGRLGMAIIYNQRHEFSKAIPEYEWVLQRDPDHLMAQYHLGLIREELGEREKAIKHYQAVLAIATQKGQTSEPVVKLSQERLQTLKKGS
jgi:tetratricopeptide (TPR) repeat protein